MERTEQKIVAVRSSCLAALGNLLRRRCQVALWSTPLIACPFHLAVRSRRSQCLHPRFLGVEETETSVTDRQNNI